jgi:hypothetical protein
VPDLEALRTAARAAIVVPAVFAVADELIGKPQTSVFAAIGAFAMLVFVEFGGPRSLRLLAYLGLAGVGAVFITLGTLVSRTPWLAAAAMAALGFIVLFSGVFGGYLAAGGTAALTLFVLPATLPAANAAIADRLEGWGLACGAAILAVMLMWPPRRRDDLRRQSAVAFRAVADLLESDETAVLEGAGVARAAVESLGRRFIGLPHRPTGPAARTAALASIPDELDWILAFSVPHSASPAAALSACPEDREALAAAAAVLRTGAERLEGGPGEPDFARLDGARDAVAEALVGRLVTAPLTAADALLPKALELPFRIRVVSYSARQLASYALAATGAEPRFLVPDEPGAPHGAQARLRTTEHLASEHAKSNSVWLQNSVRGAVGLALAVYIAQRTGLQHGFWVVLGMLSVLRSNALSTGWSVLSALAGTAVGIVAGALLVIGLGTHVDVLWGVLPVAILLGAYAPRAISLAAGQAAFTVVLFVLFNIIQPVGWRVGVVRAEDIAIGFAISLGVGLLFWPRGAGALLARNLAGAYAAAIDYVVATARAVITSGDGHPATLAEQHADDALHRLDDAFSQYLGERSASRYDLEEVAAFVAAASRVRRAGRSLAALGASVAGGPALDHCGANLERELEAVQSWYVALGYALTNRRPLPAPHIRDDEGRRRLLGCVQDAAASADGGTVRTALVLLWTSQYLDNLWHLEAHLGQRSLAPRPQVARSGIRSRLTSFAS